MPINGNSTCLQELLEEFADNIILIVGIGNVLKEDDGVGVYISRNIKETGNIRVLTVEVSIENYIGKINSLNPDILILTDCMELGQPPGSFRMISLDNIVDQTFNTHNISLNRLGEFFPMQVWVLGIQPLSLNFGEHLSNPVKETADRIIHSINPDNF
jgi:hydrogenase 3 maturation protease